MCKEILLSTRNYLVECWMYLRHSATLRPYVERGTFEPILIKHYHSIEKGLSLQRPRAGFGRDRALLLSRELADYVSRFGVDRTATVSLKVLTEYQRFNHENGKPDNEFDCSMDTLKGAFNGSAGVDCEGGTIALSREDVLARSSIDFSSFVGSRHSVRHFGEERVPLSTIQEAVRLAQLTPSVCNRQPWRVHIHADPKSIARVIAHQSGNRGFGDTASVLLTVTCDLRAFAGSQERNEAYVDGGMFAMSLTYALHSLGLGTCCLNLCQQTDQASRTKKAAGIPPNEVLVMMIAVGTLPPKLRVARSTRMPTESILTVHQD
jgi:nitroreductase